MLSAYLCIHLRASLIRARFLLLLLCFAMMGIVALRASQPAPFLATGALVHTRYLLLAVTIAGAWLLARAWPGSAGELAAALLLFQPRTLFVLEQGWAEPLVFFCFALAVYAIARRAHWALIVGALAVLALSTPYSLFLVIPLALALPRRRGLFAITAVLIAVVAPFAAGEGAFRRPLPPGRAEPLSLAPLASRFLDAPAQSLALAGLAAGAVVLVLCLRRKVDLPLACAAAAAGCAAVLLCSPQSFANGWWLCTGLLAAACPVPAPRAPAVLTRRPAEALATASGAG